MSRDKCPDCGSNRGYQSFDDGTYCHACHKLTKIKNMFTKPKKEQAILELPERISPIISFPEDAGVYLKKHYITLDDIKRCSIFWSDKYERICFPYYKQEPYEEGTETMLFCWMRTLDKTKKDKWVFVGQKNIQMYYLKYDGSNGCFYSQAYNNTLVIVEDQISCVRISNHLDCVSLGGTNISNPLLLPLMLQYDKIIVWLDGDEPGQRATERFIKKYKIYRDIRVIKTERDPKCHTNKEIEALLNDY